MILTTEQIRRYFEHRLAGQKIPRNNKPSVKCPFHADNAPSLTLFLDGSGGFNCNAGSCGAKGNLFQFEARISGCDLQTAEQNISQITGAVASQSSAIGRLTATYDYRQASGSVSFIKRRYVAPDGKKTFRIFRPDGASGWASGIGDQPKVLFHLPELITANVLLVCEGEKDCETLDALELGKDLPDVRVATTTNFEGAWQPTQSPKWFPQYTSYFAGKRVVLFPDNDLAGKARCQFLAEQLYPLASSVRIVSLDGLEEKGDVTDWMRTHTRLELQEQIKHAPIFEPQEESASRELFIPAVEFLAAESVEPDWILDGVIEAGSNGFIAADPKTGKSVAAVDLALSLACGLPWLQMRVARPVRVALVSREDNPSTTRRRMHRLWGSKGVNELVEENLYINTSAQTSSLMLDNEEELIELIAHLKKHRAEFCILDVFNRLHSGDENDNTEMVSILGKVKRLHREAGCSVAIVHHFNKAPGRNLQTKLRGSSAIAGFAEWIIGIAEIDAESHLLQMEFVTKSAATPMPVNYRMLDNYVTDTLALVVDNEVKVPAQQKPVLTWFDRKDA